MLKKIRILQAIRQGKVGGGETHVLDLVNALDPEKFESVILSFTEGPMVDKLRVDGFKTYVVATEKPFNYKIWPLVKQIVLSEKIDIIHAHGTRANSNTFSTAKLLKLPLIYTVHGWSFHPDQTPIVKLIRTLSERLLVSMADRTICVSNSNLNDGQLRFPMPKSQVILNGVNQEKFNPDADYPDVRDEFNIGHNTILVGYIARITLQKEPFTFLYAISKIPISLALKFLIVGDGDLKDQMIDLSRTLGLEERVIFQGFRDDVPAILNSVDIYCLPSLWEGLPIGVLEAMAMRKAVIATSIDGTKEIISSGENGLLIPVKSPDMLAKAIITLSNDSKLRNKLANAAKETIVKSFNIVKMSEEISAVYKKIMSN
jgi:glycosyltransferase involved in cell wall biosynthesis